MGTTGLGAGTKYVLFTLALLVVLYVMKPQLCAELAEIQKKKHRSVGTKDSTTQTSDKFEELEEWEAKLKQTEKQLKDRIRKLELDIREHSHEKQLLREKEQEITTKLLDVQAKVDGQPAVHPQMVQNVALVPKVPQGSLEGYSHTYRKCHADAKKYQDADPAKYARLLSACSKYDPMASGAAEWFPKKKNVEDMVGDREKGWCAKHARLIGTAQQGGNINGQWNQDWFAFVNFWNTPFYGYTDAPNNIRPGFFLDVGANAHKHLSNTWFLDQCLGWKGICVEANPELVTNLQKLRNCIVVPKCIHPTLNEISFNPADEQGHIVDDMITDKQAARSNAEKRRIHIPCTTLTKVVEEYNVSHVDFMSLDIEGSEMGALACIPWHKVTIDVITMENVYNTIEQRWFLMGKGYTLAAQLGQDEIFVRHGSRAAARIAAAPLIYPAHDTMMTGWRVQTGWLWKEKCCTNGERGKWDHLLQQ